MRTDNKLRKIALNIAEYEYFDSFIMAIIIINAITLTMVWVDISPKISRYTEFLQEVFNFIFLIECALKLTAYNMLYFQSGWNTFDFILVIGGLISLVLDSNFSQHIMAIRVLRAGRLLRLLR